MDSSKFVAATPAVYSGAPVRLIVLAGPDRGKADALAPHFGVSHKCLVPIGGSPLVSHILKAAAAHPAIQSIAISVEPGVFDQVFDVLSQVPGRGAAKLVEAHDNRVDSAYAAAQGWEGPLLFTTIDQPFLDERAIDVLITALKHAEAVFSLAPANAIGWDVPTMYGHPIGFADSSFAGSSLFAANGSHALQLAEVFRNGGRFGRSTWAVLNAFGPLNLIRMGMRTSTLDQTVERLCARFSTRIAVAMLEHALPCLQINDLASHAFAEQLLATADQTQEEYAA